MNYEFEITRRCNFGCPGCDRLCGVVDGGGSDFSVYETDRVLDEIIAADKQVRKFTVMGGEPTLNENCVEICRLIRKRLGSGVVLSLATNHTNNDMCRAVERFGFRVRRDDATSDPKIAAVRKAERHINIMLSPTEDGVGVSDPHRCWVFGRCGISIHKWHGCVKWCWCGAGTSVCKMLGREEFMKPSLDELFSSGTEKWFSDVCPHCQYISRQPVKARDSAGRVSKCFIDGLCKLSPDFGLKFKEVNS